MVPLPQARAEVTPEMGAGRPPVDTGHLTGVAARLSRFRKEYNRCQPLKFHRGTNIEKAYEWIRSQEMLHWAIRADEDVLVDLSTIHLEGTVA